MQVGDVELQECPVSFITAESIELVQHFFRAKNLHTVFGVPMFGPNLQEWPAGWVYAVEALELERVKVQKLMAEFE